MKLPGEQSFLILLILILTEVPAKAQDEFPRIAARIASPLFNSVDEANVGYSDGKAMLRNELAFQSIGTWTSANSALEKVRDSLYSSLWVCHDSLSKIRRLDSSTPDFEILAKRALKALPALDDSRRDAAGNLRPEDKRRSRGSHSDRWLAMGPVPS